MWRKRASRFNRRVARHRYVRAWLCGVTSCFLAVTAFTQTQKLHEIPYIGQKLLEVTVTALENPVKTDSGAVLRVERQGEFVRFTVTEDGVVTRSQWYQGTREKPHVVFGTADRRFHEVDNRVLVELINPKQLESIAEEVRAVRAKHYSSLGYSIVWLRPGQNPIEAVKRLQSDERVKHAELQLKRPLMIPL